MADEASKPLAELIEEYIRLGGTRKSLNDDNATSTRKWDSEPSDAKFYWDQHIAVLDDARRQEAETLLPSISSGE